MHDDEFEIFPAEVVSSRLSVLRLGNFFDKGFGISGRSDPTVDGSRRVAV